MEIHGEDGSTRGHGDTVKHGGQHATAPRSGALTTKEPEKIQAI